MEIKKTVGRAGLGGTRKDYVIHTQCGEKFYAKAVGSQGYECGGVNFESLKSLKAHIIDGGFATEEPDEATEASTLDGADTWDCVHPCALLITEIPHDFGLHGSLSSDVKHTLDRYGWLDEEGLPDIARAEREIARVEKLFEKS